MKPPALPRTGGVTLRQATAANVLLPGAGLFLLGRRRAGAVLAGLFLLFFLAVAGLFVVGYASYLSTAMDPDLMKGDRLERSADGFHLPWMFTLAGAGGVVYVVSSVLFVRARGRVRDGAGH